MPWPLCLIVLDEPPTRPQPQQHQPKIAPSKMQVRPGDLCIQVTDADHLTCPLTWPLLNVDVAHVHVEGDSNIAVTITTTKPSAIDPPGVPAAFPRIGRLPPGAFRTQRSRAPMFRHAHVRVGPVRRAEQSSRHHIANPRLKSVQSNAFGHDGHGNQAHVRLPPRGVAPRSRFGRCMARCSSHR